MLDVLRIKNSINHLYFLKLEKMDVNVNPKVSLTSSYFLNILDSYVLNLERRAVTQ